MPKLLLGIDTWYWIRFRGNGDSLKLKVWAGAIEDEPASWDIETTDSEITSADWVGVGGHPTSTPTSYHDYFSAATGGDTAEGPSAAGGLVQPVVFVVT